MKVTKGEVLAGLSIVVGIASSIAGFGAAAASAASLSSNTQSSSPVATSVVREDRLQAMAGVLNMTRSQVQTHLKAHDLKQVLASKGLDMQTSRQKVVAQLQSELQTQGYSQTQIDTVLQQYQQHAQRNQ